MRTVRQDIKAAFIPDELVSGKSVIAFFGDEADDEGAGRGDAQAKGCERLDQIEERVPDPDAFYHLTFGIKGGVDTEIQRV
ncbi:hypothetical protein SDC9_133262 [bioreactor metagenome]|uniref:Uncharacterized protein n=1 Tax=bioreactor metagenome TaxID=1076179 RepID=A0A645DAG4_9ZZZZ